MPQNAHNYGHFGHFTFFFAGNVVYIPPYVGNRQWTNLNDVHTRLYAFNYFLHVGANHSEVDVLMVPVNVIAKHLLALFIDIVHVVNHDHLFFAENNALCLAKRLHFISVILYPLFFQVIDVNDIVLRYLFVLVEIVIRSNQTF